MVNIGLSMTQLEFFLLVFIRMTGLFILSPIFGRNNLPALFKICFAFFLTIIFINTVSVPDISFAENIYMYVVYIFKELMIGMIIGYVTYVIMSAIYLAGQMIDMLVGFGMVNVIDPMSNIQVPLTSNFYYIYISLIFLIINGHHMIIEALFKSFQVLPVETITFNTNFIGEVTYILQSMFLIGIKIAAPIIITILISDVILGVLSRTIPQMNVFLLGMPIKIFLGLFVILVTLMAGIAITTGMTSVMQTHILDFFSALKR